MSKRQIEGKEGGEGGGAEEEGGAEEQEQQENHGGEEAPQGGRGRGGVWRDRLPPLLHQDEHPQRDPGRRVLQEPVLSRHGVSAIFI